MDLVFVPRKTLQFCVMSCIKKLLVGVEAIQLSLRTAPLSSSSSSSGAARRSSLSFLGPIREEKKVTGNEQLLASSRLRIVVKKAAELQKLHGYEAVTAPVGADVVYAASGRDCGKGAGGGGTEGPMMEDVVLSPAAIVLNLQEERKEEEEVGKGKGGEATGRAGRAAAGEEQYLLFLQDYFEAKLDVQCRGEAGEGSEGAAGDDEGEGGTDFDED
ncbi:uncharacterized protein MONOS_15103 [Monocercomonoides exilis]|uniref:uncharacterized protein n=1 Tax=Monocercomonoides exilis TaxID=2049356 RepID=UPI00355A44B9|nr:hypothetical protein MONOS_15103 [Monocercomonoides exilis]|eukprot:MONOS_15103.1-p1 / transcript=MONOS_15103.1 / gene=MONOS_15103 / organism=Monocercomonoides_exilis_PA203 / gene_product=unspecified product / transcript_product=unspecified product / location=Mono_scaffold01144:11507-12548(+) / protein_length=216 / sequence_SO=supercontig / SO=protein_coding / is_pseudo=false